MPMVDLTALVLHRHSRDFICDDLRSLGIVATAARDLAQLRAAHAARRPDLIVIDTELIDDDALALDVAARYRIRDLTLEEPVIEAIVRGIYEHSSVV